MSVPPGVVCLELVLVATNFPIQSNLLVGVLTVVETEHVHIY